MSLTFEWWMLLGGVLLIGIELLMGRLERAARPTAEDATEGEPGRTRASRLLSATPLVVSALTFALILTLLLWNYRSAAEEADPAAGPLFHPRDVTCAFGCGAEGLVENLRTLVNDTIKGHPPRNRCSRIAGVEESIEYFFDGKQEISRSRLNLRGEYDSGSCDPSGNPSIFIEVGRHDSGEVPPISVFDLSGQVEMQEGTGWRLKKGSERISEDQAVSILEISPNVSKEGDTFEIAVHLETPKKLSRYAIGTWYVCPYDFGEERLESVSARLSWPYELKDDGRTYLRLRPEKPKEHVDGSPHVILGWLKEPPSGFEVRLADKKTLTVRSTAPLVYETFVATYGIDRETSEDLTSVAKAIVEDLGGSS